jgi:hypothetical protein
MLDIAILKFGSTTSCIRNDRKLDRPDSNCALLSTSFRQRCRASIAVALDCAQQLVQMRPETHVRCMYMCTSMQLPSSCQCPGGIQQCCLGRTQSANPLVTVASRRQYHHQMAGLPTMRPTSVIRQFFSCRRQTEPCAFCIFDDDVTAHCSR